MPCIGEYFELARQIDLVESHTRESHRMWSRIKAVGVVFEPAKRPAQSKRLKQLGKAED